MSILGSPQEAHYVIYIFGYVNGKKRDRNRNGAKGHSFIHI